MAILTVVMPCYNEASRGSGQTSFENRLLMLMQQLEPIDYRVLMVDDGSTDNSVEVFNSFIKEHTLDGVWHCLTSKKNCGKGHAVLKGICFADTEFILLLDADMSVEPYSVIKLFNTIRDNECYIGTRYAQGARIVNERTALRRFVSFCCVTLVNILFSLGVSDSQCGFKLIPAKYCEKLSSFAVDSWIYDVEILYNLKAQGVVIHEAPVVWNNMERESTVKAFSAIIPSTRAVFRLFFKKWHIKSIYKGD